MAVKKTTSPKKKTGKMRTFWRIVIGFFIVLLVMLTGIGCGFLTASMNTRPDLIEDLTPSASSQIYDIGGNEIANIHAAENRRPVKLSQIPQNLQNAFIAVEDVRFYEHSGIDPRGILRAVWANISDQGVAEGGSTITQQLAKNAYLTQERTFKRKIQEMFLALQLEREYTKQEILEFYLNQIYFGQGAYGVQAAAKTYFGKEVEDLDLNECAMLAGIPKSPNYYSPFNDINAAKSRKATVLDQMQKYGFISSSEAYELKREDLKLVKRDAAVSSTVASYFIDYVTQALIDKYGADAVYKNGLKIYTTIDMDMQKQAEDAMKLLPTFGANDDGIAQPQGALVAIDPHSGQIKAMVGGRGTDQFNRATMAERQPGSAFKPFVFVAALESKFTPETIIEDSPVKVGDWEPQNYNRNFNGKVTLRYVAEQSLNVPTVKVAQRIGIEKPIYYAQEMGITTFVLEGPTNDRNLACSLGGLTRGVTPLELTSAYGTFANNGVHVEPVAILKVLDRNGRVLEQANPKQQMVVSESSAAELTDMLQGVVTKGTGAGAQIGRPAAGKTGTTSDYRDAWFVGYTPDLVTGVWIGCDDNSDLDGMTGGNLPATIWSEFMSAAVSGTPVHYFDGVVSRKSDAVREVLDDPSKKSSDSEKTKKDQRNENDKNTSRAQSKPGAATNIPSDRTKPGTQPARPNVENSRERQETRPAEKRPEPEPAPHSRNTAAQEPERTSPAETPPAQTVPKGPGGPSPSMTGNMGKGR